MESAEGKRAAVLVEKFYEDLELWYPASGSARPARR